MASTIFLKPQPIPLRRQNEVQTAQAKCLKMLVRLPQTAEVGLGMAKLRCTEINAVQQINL